ncbi:hypothetical protein HID58_061778, partial [Brassica napus]
EMMSKEMVKINPDMLMPSDDQTPKIGASLSQSKRRKISIVCIKPNIPDLNVKPCYDSDEEEKGEMTKTFQNLAGLKFHDGCYKLPKVPSSDYCFFHSDKETISVGTHLIVIGREIEGIVVFRYELENHKWFKGPSMITPRVMYGSASHGKTAFFAGGIQKDDNGNPIVVRTVEKYNADTKIWTMINGMHKARKFSSGCFLRGKFYVLGCRDENDKHLTCGESYDETTNSWELIPDMLKDMTFIIPSQSPPLIAVVDDNLYMLETSLNELRVYDINTNIWKKLGVVPVSANTTFDRLLVVGTSHSWHRKAIVYSCRPSPDVEEQHWEELKYWCTGAELPPFIHNCCEMMSKEMAKINPDMLMLSDDQTPKIGASLSQSKRRKISIVGIKPNIPDLNVKPCYDSDDEEKGEITKTFQNLAGLKSHDGCYVHHKLLYELEEMMSKEMAKINPDMLMLSDDQTPKIGASLSQSKRRKISIVGIKPNIPDLNVKPCYDSDDEEKGEITKTFQNLAGLKSHDGCYVHHKLLYELEVEIFARLPCFEYWKLRFLNKKLLKLLKSGEIFRVRQEKGLVKPYVILHSGAESNWEMFDKDFKTFQKLPKVPSSDYCFFHSDKETISVGTQLIVIGREIEGIVVFRYELENHKWFKGPSMITPRVMYGSASHGKTAFFAGGIQKDDNGNPIVVRTVEKYNADTKTRKFSSGCFLRGKFYVLGGRDENDKHLTCGESYDETTNSWELIPDMLKDMTFIIPSQSPPLIAVVDDNLYMLETSLNELRVYDINTNIWKKLGVVPVSANTTFDRLLVVGTSHSWHRKAIVYSCRPSPDVEEQHWEELKYWCTEMAKINPDMLMLSDDQTPKIGASLSQSKRRKISIVGIKPNIPDLNVKPCYDSDDEEKGEITKTFQNLAGLKSHDGCYVHHKLLYELEVEIFARLPCFEYWKLRFLNKKLLKLLKSGEIFRVRQEKGLVKPYGLNQIGKCLINFKTFQKLPKVPSSDYCFFHSDKETISVGTQLIVIGREIEGIVVFRYELENHKWFKGPSMITPRVMYGSASHGKTAFFAGGIQKDDNGNPIVVRTVEKYNADTKI